MIRFCRMILKNTTELFYELEIANLIQVLIRVDLTARRGVLLRFGTDRVLAIKANGFGSLDY